MYSLMCDAPLLIKKPSCAKLAGDPSWVTESTNVFLPGWCVCLRSKAVLLEICSWRLWHNSCVLVEEDRNEKDFCRLEWLEACSPAGCSFIPWIIFLIKFQTRLPNQEIVCGFLSVLGNLNTWKRFLISISLEANCFCGCWSLALLTQTSLIIALWHTKQTELQTGLWCHLTFLLGQESWQHCFQHWNAVLSVGRHCWEQATNINHLQKLTNLVFIPTNPVHIVSINIRSVNRCFIIFPIWRVYQSDVVVLYLSLFWKCDIIVISYSRCYERKNTLICDVNINVWYIFAFLLSSWHSQHISFRLLSISITTQMFASTLDVFLH